MSDSLNPVTLELRLQALDPKAKIEVYAFNCLRWVINAPEDWSLLLAGLSGWGWPKGYSTKAAEEGDWPCDPYHCDVARPYGENSPQLGKDRETGAMMLPINVVVRVGLPRDQGAEVWEPPLWGPLEAQAAEFERSLIEWGAGPVLALPRQDVTYPTHWSNVALEEQGAWRAMAEREALESSANAGSSRPAATPSL